MNREKRAIKVIGEKNLNLNLAAPSTKEQLIKIGKVLYSPIRIDILNLLKTKPLSLLEISNILNIPISSTALHIKCLEDAKLIVTESQPGIHGTMRVCLCSIQSIHIDAYDADIDSKDHTISIDMPLGLYNDFDIEPTCGLAGVDGIIDNYDNPQSFYSPERGNTQLLWFHSGYIEYRYPNRANQLLKLQQLTFSFEICSEAPGYSENWPSDITFFVNHIEVGSYTAPGDYGVRRGKLTPASWPMGRSQYGLLTTLSIRDDGAFINGILVKPDVTVNTLEINKYPYISLRIEIKKTAKNVGGINIFGKNYGDFNQGILMQLIY